MSNVNKKDTRTMPMTSFLYHYCQLWTHFKPCSSIYIVNFGKCRLGCRRSLTRLFLNIKDTALVSLKLTLNRFHKLFCFHCWLWTRRFVELNLLNLLNHKIQKFFTSQCRKIVRHTLPLSANHRGASGWPLTWHDSSSNFIINSKSYG